MTLVDIIQETLALNHKVRNPYWKIGMSEYWFRKETCTICISPGRRVGKSNAIVALADSCDCIIVSNNEIKQTVFREARGILVTDAEIKQFVLNLNPGTPSFRTIFVDEPSLIRDIRLVWEIPAENYVLLGRTI